MLREAYVCCPGEECGAGGFRVQHALPVRLCLWVAGGSQYVAPGVCDLLFRFSRCCTVAVSQVLDQHERQCTAP
jgi:hypothetical protein